MRTSFAFVLLLAACGGSSSKTPDFAGQQHDLAVSTGDMSASSADMKIVTPFNMPGSVNCYSTPACSTTSSTPVCCDSAGADGGFSDTCVASTSACTGTDAHAYQCGQAADCAQGQVCCGATMMSSSGSTHFTGTTCETSCATGETQLCVTATECKSGTQCVGKDISGRDVGFCQ